MSALFLDPVDCWGYFWKYINVYFYTVTGVTTGPLPVINSEKIFVIYFPLIIVSLSRNGVILTFTNHISNGLNAQCAKPRWNAGSNPGYPSIIWHNVDTPIAFYIHQKHSIRLMFKILQGKIYCDVTSAHIQPDVGWESGKIIMDFHLWVKLIITVFSDFSKDHLLWPKIIILYH